jgi:hypothetical protein
MRVRNDVAVAVDDDSRPEAAFHAIPRRPVRDAERSEWPSGLPLTDNAGGRDVDDRRQNGSGNPCEAFLALAIGVAYGVGTGEGRYNRR